MEDMQKCLSLAKFIDLESTIKKYECDCYSKYLEEVKAGNSKETDSIKQINDELEPLQTKRSNLDRTKKILIKNQEELENLKQDQEALIYFEEKTLQSILKEGETMQSHYNNKLAEMSKALQSSPQVAYALRLENQIAKSEFDIRKYNQQTIDLNNAIKIREEFRWQREKMAIVEFAQLMVEENLHQETMREIQTEIERLTRETELEKLKTRRKPALKPLKVFVAPEAPLRISPPQLTPLMDLLQSEDIPSPCSVQTQDCTMPESLEPPAKVPRRSAPSRPPQSLRQKFLSLFSLTASEDRVEPDSGTKNKASNGVNTKQIKLLDQQLLSKSEVETIIHSTQIVKLNKVDMIGSGLLQICNDEAAEEGVAAPIASSAIAPPTQFQDTDATTTAPPVATEAESQVELLDESQVMPSRSETSARVNDTGEIMDTDLSNVEFTSMHLSDFTQAKEDLEKKFNSSPDFVYTKKNKEETVTSKFFAKADERSAEVEDGSDAPAQVTAVPVPEHTSMDGTSGEDAQEVMDTAEEGCSETAAAQSELDDSTYDFTNMLVTPSLLLSPRSDEPICEMNNQPLPSTSLFGSEKRAFQLPGTAGGEGAAMEPPAPDPSPAPFTFNFHDKKKGFFSLFN